MVACGASFGVGFERLVLDPTVDWFSEVDR